MINPYGDCRQEVKILRRRRAAAKELEITKHKDMSLETKAKIMDVMIFLIII